MALTGHGFHNLLEEQGEPFLLQHLSDPILHLDPFLISVILRDSQFSGGSLEFSLGSVFFMNSLNISSGKGKTMVEVLSLATWLKV